jgi:hypothetical protein
MHKEFEVDGIQLTDYTSTYILGGRAKQKVPMLTCCRYHRCIKRE